MNDALSRYKQLLARSELPRRAGLPAVPHRAPGPELIRFLMCSGLRLSAAGLAIIGDLGSRWVRLSDASGSGSMILGSG